MMTWQSPYNSILGAVNSETTYYLQKLHRLSEYECKIPSFPTANFNLLLQNCHTLRFFQILLIIKISVVNFCYTIQALYLSRYGWKTLPILLYTMSLNRSWAFRPINWRRRTIPNGKSASRTGRFTTVFPILLKGEGPPWSTFGFLSEFRVLPYKRAQCGAILWTEGLTWQLDISCSEKGPTLSP